MNNVVKEGNFNKGKIIDMAIFQKNKSIYNERLKSGESNEFNKSVKSDDLLLEIENLNKKLDMIYLNHSNEKDIENSDPSCPKTGDTNKNNGIFSNFYDTHPFKASIVASIIATIIISICGIIFNNYILFPYRINSRFDSIEATLKDFKTQNSKKINETDTSESEILKRLSRLEVNVATIANMTGVNLYSNLQFTDSFISELATKSESVEDKYYASTPPCQGKDIIALNIESGEEYTKEQLSGQKLLIPYISNGQEVIFYGQYDDNYNWDKDCTINVYENDKLILISETVYKNGTPLSSKLIYTYETKGNKNVWCITNREYDEKFNNIDETWYYFKVNEYPKTFDFENANIDDLLYVSQFKNDIKNSSSLEGYYCDKIVDDDKKSYMIKNDENGFIRTLYIGKFEDGDLHDRTGAAIEIVFDESVNKYFCYTGKFKEGNRDSNNELNYKTQDEINEIIKPYEFNCELNWYDTTKDTN